MVDVVSKPESDSEPICLELELTPETLEQFRTEICDPIHYVLLWNAMKSCEDELLNSITSDTTLIMAKIAKEKGIIPLQIVRTLESMDPCVPQQLMYRYLMLQVNIAMSSKKLLMNWLEALSVVEGIDRVISDIKQSYDSLIFKVGSVLLSSDKKVKDFGGFLCIDKDRVEYIVTEYSSMSCALEEILSWWYTYEGIPVKLSLENALHGDSILKRKLMIAIEKTCKLKLPYNPSVPLEVKIIDQTTESGVIEGCSALLKVQVEGDVKDYEWCLNGNTSMQGARDSILCLHSADLLSEGYYTCKVGTYGSDQKLESSPIHVTVNTSLDRHQKILIDRYTAQPEVPVDTWPPVSSGTFINLALIKQESIQNAGKYARCSIWGDIDDILKDKESISYDKAMGDLFRGSFLLVEGRPGSGKTTLMHKFSQDWAKMEMTVRHVRLLFLVHLRGFFNNPSIGLRDIVSCYYEGNAEIEEIMEYAGKHNGLGFCFILDGLDEYLPEKKNCFIFRLIKKHVLPRSVVIVASRPAAAADFRSIATRQVEVLGFHRDAINKYVKNYPFSSGVNSKHEGLLKYFKEHPNVFHMCYLPIHSCMVCFLYNCVNADLPETETEIYGEFTKFAILRTLYRSEGLEAEIALESINDLPEIQIEQYLKTCELAFDMLLSSKQVVRQAEIEHLSPNFLQNEKGLYGLIIVDKMAMKCGFQKLYTFLHLTFQEFLAAYHISTSLTDKEQMELIEEHGKTIHMKQVWKFYCGLVKFQSTCTKFNALVRRAQHGPLFSIQCSFESQQPHTCNCVVVNNSFDLKDSLLTVPDFSAMAFVLSNAQDQCVTKIALDNCTFVLDEVEDPLIQSNDRLSYITTLCYHGYDGGVGELNKLLNSLVCLKFLDLTKTKLTYTKILALTNKLSHSSLQILKVNSSEKYLPCTASFVVQAFFSCCSNLINVCFSGTEEVNLSYATKAPFHFHCNCKEINLNFCKLRPVELEVLSADIAVNSDVTTSLSLVSCGIDDDMTSCLARGLKHSTALETLDLSCNSIGDEGAIALADDGIYSQKLHTLHLSCNRIGDEGAIAIACAGKAAKSFKIYLWNNKISIPYNMLDGDIDFHTFVHKDAPDSTSLSHYLRDANKRSCKDLSVLSLKGHMLSHRVMESLCMMLKLCSNLKSLTYISFDEKGKGLEGSTDLIPIVKYCTKLNTLVLPGMELGGDGTEALANFLGENKHLQKLDISHSKNMKISSLSSIFPNALDSCNVRSLNISSCNIGNDGAEALFGALNFCTNIRKLDISSNCIQGITLAQGLIHCTDLITLNVSKNPIGGSGMKTLTSALKYCAGLKKLVMFSIGIRTEDAAHLTDLVRCLRRLHKITLGERRFKSETTVSLVESLQPIPATYNGDDEEFIIFLQRELT